MVDKELLEAAHKAAATIQGIYQWIDMIDEEGGATNVAGIAKCHAFLKSMRRNRTRLDDLIIKPLNAAIDRAEASQ